MQIRGDDPSWTGRGVMRTTLSLVNHDVAHKPSADDYIAAICSGGAIAFSLLPFKRPGRGSAALEQAGSTAT
jgi:hypothetical protein